MERILLNGVWKLRGRDEKGTNHYLSGFPAFSLTEYKKWLEEGLI